MSTVVQMGLGWLPEVLVTGLHLEQRKSAEEEARH